MQSSRLKRHAESRREEGVDLDLFVEKDTEALGRRTFPRAIRSPLLRCSRRRYRHLLPGFLARPDVGVIAFGAGAIIIICCGRCRCWCRDGDRGGGGGGGHHHGGLLDDGDGRRIVRIGIRIRISVRGIIPRPTIGGVKRDTGGQTGSQAPTPSPSATVPAMTMVVMGVCGRRRRNGGSRSEHRGHGHRQNPMPEFVPHVRTLSARHGQKERPSEL